MPTDVISNIQTLPPTLAPQGVDFLKSCIKQAVGKTLPPVLTLQDVQDYLRISRPKTYELAHTRGFPAFRCGRAIRVTRDSFLRWLDRQAGVEEER